MAICILAIMEYGITLENSTSLFQTEFFFKQLEHFFKCNFTFYVICGEGNIILYNWFSLKIITQYCRYGEPSAETLQ